MDATEEKVDRRVKRTNRLLQDALIELTLEHGYDAVTIREITERADVGYATFFRHYSDKDALLAAVLQTMKDNLSALLTPHGIFSNPEYCCTLLFQYVRDNVELCRVLLSSTSITALLRPLQDMGLQDVLHDFGSAAVGSGIPAEIAANHLISSLIMMMRWWIDSDLPYSPEEMGKIAAGLVIRPLMMVMAKGS